MKEKLRHCESYLLPAAPLIFVCHVLEEAPGFVEWFNSHVTRGISPDLFWRVNISAFVVTVILVALDVLYRSQASAGVCVAWLSFIMFANAVFHIVGSAVDQRYVPGLITAFFYIVYCGVLAANFVKNGRMTSTALVILVFLGSTPMLVHGYLILFHGGRLF